MGTADFNRGRVQIFSISGFSAQELPKGVDRHRDWLGVMGSAAVIVVPGGARRAHASDSISGLFGG
jgi:hypothetical protein